MLAECNASDTQLKYILIRRNGGEEKNRMKKRVTLSMASLFDCWYALFTKSDMRDCAFVSVSVCVPAPTDCVERVLCVRARTQCILSLYGNWWRDWWCAHLSAFIILLDTFYCIAFVSFQFFIILFRCFIALSIPHTHTQSRAHDRERAPGHRMNGDHSSNQFDFSLRSSWISNERQSVLETRFFSHPFVVDALIVLCIGRLKDQVPAKSVRYF